jgi:hypothetical protein
VNKKKQKNFDYLKHVTRTVANPAGIKSFLLLFFKKEVLSSAFNFNSKLQYFGFVRMLGKWMTPSTGCG